MHLHKTRRHTILACLACLLAGSVLTHSIMGGALHQGLSSRLEATLEPPSACRSVDWGSMATDPRLGLAAVLANQTSSAAADHALLLVLQALQVVFVFL